MIRSSYSIAAFLLFFIFSYSYAQELERVQCENGKFGFKDKETGETIIPFKFDDVGYFSEGLAPAKLGKKWGYVDKTGATVIPFKYGQARGFYEGLAAVNQRGKFGYIDKNGKNVIPFRYETVASFADGVAPVSRKRKHGFIDKTGAAVVPLMHASYNDAVNAVFEAKDEDFRARLNEISSLRFSERLLERFPDGTFPVPWVF